jgi:ABC transporter DrrB family efflux protein
MSDTWVLTQRAFQHWARQPGVFAVGLLFPVLMVVMFGYLFGAGIEVPGGGDYLDYLMPGMFVVAMFFGVEVTMAAVSADASKGVTDRFRSMPMRQGAVVAGRSVADMVNAVLGLTVMVATGLLVGWSWHEGVGNALVAFGLLLLLRFALVWVGIYLGLVTSTPEAIAAVQILVWPIAGLSSAFSPTEPMPDWLGTIADWNPLSATAAALRDLFGNPGYSSDSWIGANATLMAVVWPLVILAIFVPLSLARWSSLSER